MGGRNKAPEALLVVLLVLFFVVFLCRLLVCFLPDLLGSWHACLLCFFFPLSAAPILSRLLFLGAPFPCALLSSSAIFVESSGDDDLCEEEEEDCEEVEQMFAGVYRSLTLAFQMHAAVL